MLAGDPPPLAKSRARTPAGEHRQVEALAHDQVRVEGLDHAFDPSEDPPFALVAECDRCGRRDLDQFPLETGRPTRNAG